VRITALDEGHLVADLEVVDGHGRVRLRARGWRDRRYRMPGRVYSFRLDPLHEAASTRWQTPVAGRPDAACCRIDLPPEGQGADADFWRMVLAWLALCPAEREEFLALRADESRRTAWLLGRVAAKDAARLLLRERHGIELFPADVHVCAEPGGRLVLAGEWAGRVPRVPAVSVSHTGGVVVAIAVDADVRGAGVDVERLRPLDPSFEEVAFDDAERSLLSRVPGERREEWLLRLWCAKEAAGKALGTGLAGDPRSLAIRALEDDTAGVRVVPAGSRNGGPGLLVRTGRDGDLVYATAVDELREA
jgi:phosphopantetheinyl transferase